ncbi:MAG: DsbA family protein [Agarilytica sp.]
MTPIKITHYSDVLCIWAYISQIRVDELLAKFGERISLEYHFMPVFGDAHRKIVNNWQDRGGVEAYHKHIAALQEEFEHIRLHPKVWIDPTPRSSMPAHLYLAAARLLEEEGHVPHGAFRQFLKHMRESFFVDNRDVSNCEILKEIVSDSPLPTEQVENLITCGKAYAALSHDFHMVNELNINSSPTLIFNENRQRLAGNVGYKIIEANVNELLELPIGGQSWC